jgi:hypothetical protein
VDRRAQDGGQEQELNGQQPAFRFYVTVLAVLLFVNQTDGDLVDDAAAKAPAAKRRDTPRRRRTDKQGT